MKQMWVRVMGLLMAFAMLGGCGSSEERTDAPEKLQQILSQVQFDTELSEVGSNAVLYFPDLPAGSEIRLYNGSGYFADEAALLTFPSTSDAKKGMKVVERHLAELKSQFQNYVPEEVGKIENAVSMQIGSQILLCITADTDTVRAILDGSLAAPAPEAVSTQPTVASEPEPKPSDGYPVLSSRSGTYEDYGSGIIRVDDAAYELYTYSAAPAQAYAQLINSVADTLQGKTQVYDLVIPTGAILLPDDIAAKIPANSDQGEAIRQILSMLGSNVTGVNPYPGLMQHRDEYLYFHTDYHWNGRGAYYAYEAFCEAKGITPYPLEKRRLQQFGGFLGALYWNNSGEDPILKENPDTVEAFHPYSPNSKMHYTDARGNTYDWNIIMDVSDWKASTKYSTFAAADNPIAVFENPDVTDGSVAVVVKESYGNALLPYLVDHYSTIYELDYRYWEGNLLEFVEEQQADDLIFTNNLSMIGSNLLIGKLADIIQ